MSSPASAAPSQNPSIRALQGESGFDGSVTGKGQVSTPGAANSIDAIFQRMANAINSGNLLGMLF